MTEVKIIPNFWEIIKKDSPLAYEAFREWYIKNWNSAWVLDFYSFTASNPEMQSGVINKFLDGVELLVEVKASDLSGKYWTWEIYNHNETSNDDFEYSSRPEAEQAAYIKAFAIHNKQLEEKI